MWTGVQGFHHRRDIGDGKQWAEADRMPLGAETSWRHPAADIYTNSNSLGLIGLGTPQNDLRTSASSFMYIFL